MVGRTWSAGDESNGAGGIGFQRLSPHRQSLGLNDHAHELFIPRWKWNVEECAVTLNVRIPLLLEEGMPCVTNQGAACDGVPCSITRASTFETTIFVR